MRRLAVFLGLLVFAPSLVSAAAPACIGSNGMALPLNNEQVAAWKTSTPSGYKERAHVFGVVIGLYPDRDGHDHVALQIGRGPKDVVELIHNYEFGALPQIQRGMKIEACGDFINSFQQNGPYRPSPAGAIVHWTHASPALMRNLPNAHPHGFVVIDGTVYGFDLSGVMDRNKSSSGKRAYEVSSEPALLSQ